MVKAWSRPIIFIFYFNPEFRVRAAERGVRHKKKGAATHVTAPFCI
jgi:hypothetical protein